VLALPFHFGGMGDRERQYFRRRTGFTKTRTAISATLALRSAQAYAMATVAPLRPYTTQRIYGLRFSRVYDVTVCVMSHNEARLDARMERRS
jgi:hypothetical protein